MLPIATIIVISSWMAPAAVTVLAGLLVAVVAALEYRSFRNSANSGWLAGVFTFFALITAVISILVAWGVWLATIFLGR